MHENDTGEVTVRVLPPVPHVSQNTIRSRNKCGTGRPRRKSYRGKGGTRCPFNTKTPDWVGKGKKRRIKRKK